MRDTRPTMLGPGRPRKYPWSEKVHPTPEEVVEIVL